MLIIIFDSLYSQLKLSILKINSFFWISCLFDVGALFITIINTSVAVKLIILMIFIITQWTLNTAHSLPLHTNSVS